MVMLSLLVVGHVYCIYVFVYKSLSRDTLLFYYQLNFSFCVWIICFYIIYKSKVRVIVMVEWKLAWCFSFVFFFFCFFCCVIFLFDSFITYYLFNFVLFFFCSVHTLFHLYLFYSFNLSLCHFVFFIRSLFLNLYQFVCFRKQNMFIPLNFLRFFFLFNLFSSTAMFAKY